MGESGTALGEFEQMILLAVLCAQQDDGDAYGVTVHRALTRRTSRRIALGAVYMTLDRLEKKGLLTSSVGPPTDERGGRSRRCYTVTTPALTALRASRRALTRLWEGLPASR